MPNLLVSLMPVEVREEFYEAGAEFSLRAGSPITPGDLGGKFIFVVESGVASKFLRSNSGLYSEVGMVGNEGMFPICGLLGVAAAPHMVIAQIGDLKGRRIRTREFHSIIAGSEIATTLIHKYVYAFVTQISSNILTSEQDMVEVRIARWLLMCHDRIVGNELPITHDTLAQMMYAQRPTVTNTLNELKQRGLIDLARGRIEIVSRKGLSLIADGSYGLSERYWRENIGPFGKHDEAKDVQQSQSVHVLTG